MSEEKVTGAEAPGGPRQGSPIVTAIVSTYNSERFMSGCLEDLEAQTIADQIEIIVIDSNSPQNEGAIVDEFRQRYDNIVYVRTPQREPASTAVNRAIRIAHGRYLTTANTDDRHRPDAFERMARALDEKPDIGLVYANVYITTTENETFEKHTRAGAYRWIDFDPLRLVYGCYIGPQPLWRRSLHEKYGYFDETLEWANDWEFWLRLAQGEIFYHLDEFLGLYLLSPTSAQHKDPVQAQKYDRIVQDRYLPFAARLRAERLAGARSTPAGDAAGDRATEAPPLVVVLASHGPESGSFRDSLVASTRLPLSISVCLDPAEGLGSPREVLHDLPEGWRRDASPFSAVARLNQAARSPGEAPVLLLATDLMVTPGWLERLLAVLESDHEVAIVGPAANRAPRPQRVKAAPEETGRELRRFAARRADHLAGQRADVPYLGGFCLAFNRAIYWELDGLREDLPLADALWDYFRRARASGRKLSVALDSYVYHEKLATEEGSGFDDLYAAEAELDRDVAQGEAAVERGELEAAAALFARVAQRHPDAVVGHAALGGVLAALGRHDESAAALHRAVALKPEDASLRNHFGVVLFRTGDAEGAETAFRQACLMGPSDLQPVLNLANLFHGQGRYVEATAAIKDALGLDPNQPDALATFGVLCLELGDLEGAGMAVRRLESVSPGHETLAALRLGIDTLGPAICGAAGTG